MTPQTGDNESGISSSSSTTDASALGFEKLTVQDLEDSSGCPAKSQPKVGNVIDPVGEQAKTLTTMLAVSDRMVLEKGSALELYAEAPASSLVESTSSADIAVGKLEVTGLDLHYLHFDEVDDDEDALDRNMHRTESAHDLIKHADRQFNIIKEEYVQIEKKTNQMQLEMEEKVNSYLAPMVKAFEDRVLHMKYDANRRIGLVTERKVARLRKHIRSQKAKKNAVLRKLISIVNRMSREYTKERRKHAAEVKLLEDENEKDAEYLTNIYDTTLERKTAEIAELKRQNETLEEELKKKDNYTRVAKTTVKTLTVMLEKSANNEKEQKAELETILLAKAKVDKERGQLIELVRRMQAQKTQNDNAYRNVHKAYIDLKRDAAHAMNRVQKKVELLDEEKNHVISLISTEIDKKLVQKDAEIEELEKKLEETENRLQKTMEESEAGKSETDKKLDTLMIELSIVTEEKNILFHRLRKYQLAEPLQPEDLEDKRAYGFDDELIAKINLVLGKNNMSSDDEGSEDQEKPKTPEARKSKPPAGKNRKKREKSN